MEYNITQREIPDYKEIINNTSREDYKEYLGAYIAKYFSNLIIKEDNGKNAAGILTKFYNQIPSIKGDLFLSPEYQEAKDFMTDVEICFMFDKYEIFEVGEANSINEQELNEIF